MLNFEPMNRIEKIADFFSDFWQHSFATNYEKIFATVLGVGLLYLLRVVVIRLSRRSIQKDIIFMRWKKGTNTTFYLLALLFAGFIWVHGFNSFATLIGLVSAGLAIAFKEPLLNIGGWAYILARRVYIIGDRIEIDKVSGDVLDIRLFMTTIQEVGGERNRAEQPTGRIVHMPNAKVFNYPVINFTETTAHIFQEISLTLTIVSKWELAESKMLEIINAHPEYWKAPQKVTPDNSFREYYLFGAVADPEVFTRVTQDGIELSLRYTVDPRKVRKIEDALWRELLPFIQAHPELEMAYRPRRIVSNTGDKIG
jgi:small-conductance mechanosensitive channel